MPRVSIGDAFIHYDEQGSGPPLLLVPGLSGLGSFWAPQVADFARDFRVITHDHRGAGQSTHSGIEYSVEQMADDVLRLMDRLGIIPGAKLLVLGTGGHLAPGIVPDEYNAAVGAFLREHRAPWRPG